MSDQVLFMNQGRIEIADADAVCQSQKNIQRLIDAIPKGSDG
jgi:hypothetical protein